VRQLASRARRRVREDRPRFPPTRAQQRAVLDAFTVACTQGDLEALVTLLDPDVVWRADGGAVRAEPVSARGAARIAALIVGYARRPPARMLKAVVNGEPGLVIRDADDILSVLTLTVDDGKIVAIDVIRDPAKLSRAASLLAAAEEN
jgi:RNA polymerase sigma-70 factor (ECF subfamily)